MKMAFITAAVLLSRLHAPDHPQGFQPVCKLPRTNWPNASRFITARQVAKDSTIFNAAHYKFNVTVSPVISTDADDKMAVIIKTRSLPVKFSMSASGAHMKRLRLTYVHNIF